MVTLIRHDLEFILEQIKIAEAHAAGTPLTELVSSPLLPYGLRTVDGSDNNLVPGRERWGASHEEFLRLTDPTWRDESDDQMMFGTPENPVWLTNNDYAPGSPTSPGFQPGTVVDADPRLISNLIVDQTLDNPAAIAAALRHAGVEGADMTAAVQGVMTAHSLVKGTVPGSAAHAIAQAQLADLLDQHGIEMDGPTIRLPNQAPDEGLSASYNAWFTLFGQFFDHGLDLVQKGGHGTVYIPLQPDDPLYDPDSPHTNFMAMSRATIGDGAANVTTPWVDQNQTYTSHPSHQVFLREYAEGPDGPVSTGKLLEGARGMATWRDVKDQARELLGIDLTDLDVGAVPVLLTDPYGEFIRGPNGLPQILAAFDVDGMPIWVEGNLADPVDPSAIQLPPGTVLFGGNVIDPGETVSAARTGNAFLDDIAHNAVPVAVDGVLQPDGDDAPGYSGGFDARGNRVSYDDEMLDAHYITGDGRGNENIGLTAVHSVFHAEHNRLVDHIKQVILDTGDADFIAEWRDADGNWDGERLFQTARFTTEMEYQHLVFEEFARKAQPDVDIFMVQPDVEINPAIFAEFAHVVYRFGHSMLNETVDQIHADGSTDHLTLFDAFLNPLAFGSDTVDHHQAAGAIVRGMTGQVGNEIDEFVTNVLRNQLVGIPLDLAAINIARGRDTGMPTLNEARQQFMDMAGGDSQLKPYDSWVDFAVNLKNPESIVNFLAAYGTHDLITGEETVAGKRAAAMAIVFGTDQTVFEDGGARVISAPADRLAFLSASGEFAAHRGGLDDVDLWVGGLAEKKMPFGGMLGSTFAFIFELQMENLQHADRFYYLSRAQGLNLLTELENNSLASIVMRNTDLGATGFALPGDIFSIPDHVLYVDAAKQAQFGHADPVHDNPTLEAISSLVERGENFIRYNGADHTVIAGTEGNDTIIAGGGDDAIRGFGGDDRIEAGYGVDIVHGGDGNDIITNAGTDIGETDMLHGDAGNDVIHGGSGMALIFGGSGRDFLMTGPDGSEIRGGTGDDFLMGGNGPDMLFGNEGDDWVEGHGLFDYIAGDNGDIFFNSSIIGHDVLNGGSGDTDYDADSGDDIMIAGEGIQKFIGMWGHDWVAFKGQQVPGVADMNFPVFDSLPLEVLRDRFSQVEALSGWIHDDILRGDDRSDEEGDQELAFDPTPEGNFIHNELDQAGIDRIAGLDRIITPDMMRLGEYWADGSGAEKMIFTGGNILLSGGGGDLIEGRGGNDVIDGDAWLNLRISILDAGGTEIATAEGMSAVVTDLAGNVLHGGRTLDLLMLERVYDPGQLQITREILWDDSGTDTAVYWDLFENYAVTRNADGSIRIEHLDETAGVIDPITNQNRVSDGIDTLYNIEVLQFGDVTINVSDLFNAEPVGQPLISDTTPTQGQALAVDLSGISDADGIDMATMSVQWQSFIGGLWTDIAGATGASFTPGLAHVNTQLRVVARYTDGFGKAEEVISSVTSPVGVHLVGNGTAETMSGTVGADIIEGRGGNDTISGLDGDDLLNGEGGNDLLLGGGGNDTLNGGAGADTLEGDAGDDLLNGGAGNDALSGGDGDDELIGEAGVDLLDGGAGNDALDGGIGNDTLDGGLGNDTLIGGVGADVIRGGDGDDLVQWNVGDGRDTIDGGAGTDTVHVTGDATAEAYHIWTLAEWRAAAAANNNQVLNGNVPEDTEIIITRNGTNYAAVVAIMKDVEEVVISGMGGGDTFAAHGDFTGTSLSYSTITLEGGAGDDVLDISGLHSAHRVLFRSNGGQDTIIGQLREQDVIEMPGSDAGHTITHNPDGTTTLTAGVGSVTFTGPAAPPAQTEPDDTSPLGDGPDDVAPPDGAGAAADLTLIGTGKADVLQGGEGADIIRGGEGSDFLGGGGGRDVILGGSDADDIFGGAGADMLYGDAGHDRIFGGDDGDMITGGTGNDTVFGGKGGDLIVATKGDGDDVYYGDEDADTLDMSQITANITADLGTGFMGRGSVSSEQTGSDTIWSIENIVTGSGNDVITASAAVNVMDGGGGKDVFRFLSAQDADGDTIVDFAPGDRIDLSAIDADAGAGGKQSFTLVTGEAFTGRGQLMVVHETREDGDYTVVMGNTTGDDGADFRISLKGAHILTANDFNL